MIMNSPTNYKMISNKTSIEVSPIESFRNKETNNEDKVSTREIKFEPNLNLKQKKKGFEYNNERLMSDESSPTLIKRNMNE